MRPTPTSDRTNDRRNLLNIEFSVLKTVLLIPSLIVPPKLPGLCSGISITFEDKTSPVLYTSYTNVISQIPSFTFKVMIIGWVRMFPKQQNPIIPSNFLTQIRPYLTHSSQYASFSSLFLSFIQITCTKFIWTLFVSFHPSLLKTSVPGNVHTSSSGLLGKLTLVFTSLPHCPFHSLKILHEQICPSLWRGTPKILFSRKPSDSLKKKKK